MDINKRYEELISMIKDKHNIKKEAHLGDYTYTKTGGKADILIFPTSYEEVQKIVSFSYKESIPLTILGNGSNLIIKDGGIRGIVMNLTKMTEIRCIDNRIMAQSGAAIIDVSRFALSKHLTGLEFACGIPGSVGGALYMNAGAYGGETADVLLSALVVTSEGKTLRLNKDQLDLGYRSSAIAKQNYLVLEAEFLLKSGNERKIKEKMDELTYLRESKQPLEYPSCGSVFKRPPGHFAGKLIQDSGLQGTQVGGVQVSTKHAGFMVNVNHGTATDYLNLIQLVKQTVKEKFNVELETEVKVIGED
ncbi:UDP-N-acetylmuramate dehydrogenase [Terrilactibacillus laevilacticus]|uniref:UDP-N-acetylenolpyruvoylglucosamine reductase n=1 Tax=Terrilactibacillus laevilacticus TaxID=1380157 RepID=A0ABW5PTS3_9BACI|nr:UDP-N-acetylmuramate dehydrogenase [Terrilactibacillus laevilacticus]